MMRTWMSGLLLVAVLAAGGCGAEEGAGSGEASAGALETTSPGMGTAGDSAGVEQLPLTPDPSTTTQVDTPGVNGVATSH